MWACYHHLDSVGQAELRAAPPLYKLALIDSSIFRWLRRGYALDVAGNGLPGRIFWIDYIRGICEQCLDDGYDPPSRVWAHL